MSIKIDYTGWNFYRDIVQQYGDYYLYNYGDKTVYVEDIVGLSYEGVLSQEKLDRLDKSIKENGYKFKLYQDLHLVLMPNSQYSVSSGGNHRPYLAKKLGIKKIKGMVEILIPKRILTEEQIRKCEEINPIYTDHSYLRQLCEVNNLLPKNVRINTNYIL